MFFLRWSKQNGYCLVFILRIIIISKWNEIEWNDAANAIEQRRTEIGGLMNANKHQTNARKKELDCDLLLEAISTIH